MGVSESQFYMWRTIFALAHADDKITAEEVRFMAEALEDVDFSTAQHDILSGDVSVAQDTEMMFKGIREVADQAAFFRFAHELVHIDGHYAPEEQAAILRLKALYVQNTDVDALIGRVPLELECDGGGSNNEQKQFTNIVHAFRDVFLKGKGDKP